MPIYNAQIPINSVAQGEQATILNAELPDAALKSKSQQVAICDAYGMPPRPIVVTFTYATVPASTSFKVQCAWDDIDTSYADVANATTTNVNGDQITIQRGANAPNFRFLRVVCLTAPAVATTVKVQ